MPISRVGVVVSRKRVAVESTEAYDRGNKFLAYQSIETFEEYLLIAQDKPYITHYVRQPDGQWLRSDNEGSTGK